METDHIRKTLEHYRKLRQHKLEEVKPHLDEIRGYDALIQRLADDLKEPANIEPLPFEAAPATGAHAGNGATPPSARMTIAPDDFFGMSQSDAAKMYLRSAGKAISMDELVGALQSGGAKLGGVDPKRTLYVSLKANPKKEFVWPSKDHIGLAEFYQKRK